MSFAPKTHYRADPVDHSEPATVNNIYKPGVFHSSEFVDGSAILAFPAERTLDELTTKVEQLLRRKPFNLENTLKAIADGIYEYFHASGVAIAMQQGDVIRCAASAGETAPELGTELDVLSGISGKCFRTGEPQYCYDARNDDRVDAASCRGLGILSILIAPIRLDGRTLGLVEVFSTQDFFFDKKEVADLQAIAVLVARAHQQQLSRVTAANTVESIAELKAALKLAPVVQPPPPSKNGYRLLLIAITTTLILVASWTLVRALSDLYFANAAPPPVVTTPAPVEDVAVVEPPKKALASKGVPKKAGPSKPATANTRDELAISISQTTTAWDRPGNDALKIIGSAPDRSAPGTAEAASNPANIADDAPHSVDSTPPKTAPDRLETSQFDLGPPLKAPLPKYPETAKIARVQGPVVLAVRISKEGVVEDLRVVSGHPMLTPAAMETVKNWRYRPYLIDGQPVNVDTTIRLNFRLP